VRKFKVRLFGICPCQTEVEIEATDAEDADVRCEALLRTNPKLEMRLQQPMFLGSRVTEASQIVAATAMPSGPKPIQ